MVTVLDRVGVVGQHRVYFMIEKQTHKNRIQITNMAVDFPFIKRLNIRRNDFRDSVLRLHTVVTLKKIG